MQESRLWNQIRKDRDEVSHYSERVRNSYAKEYTGVIDKGRNYSFGSGNIKST